MKYYLKEEYIEHISVSRQKMKFWEISVIVYTKKGNRFTKNFICERNPREDAIKKMLSVLYIKCNIFKWIKYKIRGV